ncbi:SIR2 family protein [Spiroplasma floricola]|uniref:NAD(+) hydrolase ThsA Sir2/TIR-associating SLOG domain-containing protein n=1 Tax=Spiroplasma floricola 23-6 TaxID=1336749 RepID=A0A2K8SCW2_9MOLU|nr:SIR2 family protein [Spiroplasma floricola]AUB31273.1 hypothetical protein SFLOR_v1c02120 [Spiroplasma floricola 23-6]
MNNSIIKKSFIKQFAQKILEKKALVFLGSGINKEVGLPDWKELMQDLYEDLDIKNSEQNYIDYIDLAQFLIHSTNGRHDLITKILKKIDIDKDPGPNLLEICKLPVKEFWTTNYDNLIEKSMLKLNKKYKKIVTKNNFAFLEPYLTNIYKMHGDIENENKIIISRKDYDSYANENLFFWNKLTLELSYKSCVFVGTSFNDYNLNIILSKISTLLDKEEKPNHFIFFEKDKNEEIFKLQNYKSIDLFKRFNIKTIWLENWNELQNIFKEINNKIIENNIFISGTAIEFNNNFNKKEAKKFISELTYKLIERQFKIFSGYGIEIGDSVITGAMSKILENSELVSTDKLEVLPFPQFVNDENKKNEIWQKNREYMILNSNVVIFLFGNKKDKNSEKIIISNGMIDEEFKIAKQLGKKVIPIPITGYAAFKIFEKIEKEIENFPYLKKHIDTLKNTRDIDQIIKIIESVVEF